MTVVRDAVAEQIRLYVKQIQLQLYSGIQYVLWMSDATGVGTGGSTNASRNRLCKKPFEKDVPNSPITSLSTGHDCSGVRRVCMFEHGRAESDANDLERRDVPGQYRPVQTLVPPGLEPDGTDRTSSVQHDRHLAGSIFRSVRRRFRKQLDGELGGQPGGRVRLYRHVQ